MTTSSASTYYALDNVKGDKMQNRAEVTLLVNGETEPHTFFVDAVDQDTAVSIAESKLMADWSLDDRINAQVELVGVRFA